jgi:hypothetical protein
MARSQDAKRKRTNRLVYAIPLVALILIAAVYAVSVLPASSSPAAMDFTGKLLIAEASSSGGQQRYWAPTRPVGEPGGIWETHQYDSYGVDSHYPIYIDDPLVACPSQQACLFHVKSNTVHQYVLGDFLTLVGYPVVSENNTLGLSRNGSYVWELCTGPTGHTLPNLQWGALELQPNIDITLLYYNQTSGAGCA